MTAAPIAMIVGAPLLGMILSLDGWLGLAGWQWLFVLEGFPAVVLGVMALRVFTDRPEQAAWLSVDERQWLTRTLDAERAARSAHSHSSVLSSLTNGKVWLLSFTYFLTPW